MKRNKLSRWFELVAMGLALAGLLSVLCACNNGNVPEEDSTAMEESESESELEPSAGAGIVYIQAPSSYEPVWMGSQCGTMRTGSQSSVLYEIKGIDPLQWLTTEAGEVFYNKETPLPSLSDMKPVALTVSSDRYTSIELGRLDDVEKVRALSDQVAMGELVQKPLRAPSVKYTIRFESEEYPGIYYRLEYLEYALPVMSGGVSHGCYFLYDSDSQCMVAVDKTLYHFLNGVDEELDGESTLTERMAR